MSVQFKKIIHLVFNLEIIFRVASIPYFNKVTMIILNPAQVFAKRIYLSLYFLNFLFNYLHVFFYFFKFIVFLYVLV